MPFIRTLLCQLGALLSSMLSPSRVRLNQNAGLIRLIACICMVIDHAGKMFFPISPKCG